MNHHIDIQIQSSTKEDGRVFGVLKFNIRLNFKIKFSRPGFVM